MSVSCVITAIIHACTFTICVHADHEYKLVNIPWSDHSHISHIQVLIAVWFLLAQINVWLSKMAISIKWFEYAFRSRFGSIIRYVVEPLLQSGCLRVCALGQSLTLHRNSFLYGKMGDTEYKKSIGMCTFVRGRQRQAKQSFQYTGRNLSGKCHPNSCCPDINSILIKKIEKILLIFVGFCGMWFIED